MAAHLLADSGDGELPEVPICVSAMLTEPLQQQAILLLCHLLLSIPQLCLDVNLKQLASPR